MAKETSLCFFFLSFLIASGSGSLVGFSYHERGDTSTSTLSAGYLSFLQQTKLSPSQIRIHVTDHKILSTLSLTNSNVSVDFYLNKTLVEKFITSRPFVISWLKDHILNLLPQVDIKTIIVSCGSECFTQNEIPSLVSALRSVHLALSKLHLAREVKISVAFPLSVLEKLNASCEKDLSSILSFIKEVKSFVIIEDTISAELSITGNHFVQSITKRATLAASILPWKDVPLVMTIKSLVIGEVAQFSDRVFKFLEARSDITKRIVALYAEVHTRDDFAQKEVKREEEELTSVLQLHKVIILSKSHKRRILDDTTNPANTVFPTNPTSGTTPIITTPDTPTIITVPSTNNPVTISPANPATMPVTIPSTTPVPLPPTNPANSPVPVTNPVTSYPTPSSSGSVPAVNQQPPPATVNAPPATQGQSWCVAKSGAPESSLQAALDYACGMGGADCSQIQQDGSCYNPVTLQNHASFAFNSYYQKHPAPTSCDFGGTATIVSTNPSSGSCIFPSSSSTSTSSSPTTPTTSPPTAPTPSISAPPSNPTTPPPSTPTAPRTPSVPTTPSSTSSSTSGSGTSGYGTPPLVLNSSNPASSSSSGTMPTGFGFQTPPDVNTTTSSSSHSTTQRSLVGYIILVISFVIARLSLRP